MVPCYNEQATLQRVLDSLPKTVKGISSIDRLVVDDGSTDLSRNIAIENDVDIISHTRNLGLGAAFRSGFIHALKGGYDILVNVDADNQYPAKYVEALVRPIISGKYDLVIGNRTPWNVVHFSKEKQAIQYFGNLVARTIIDVDVPDVVSGFRAYSLKALVSLHPISRFSYVIETLFQAKVLGLRIKNIPIQTNKTNRKSRLARSILLHVYMLGIDLFEGFILWKATPILTIISFIGLIGGILIFRESLYYGAFIGVLSLLCLMLSLLVQNQKRSLLQSYALLSKKKENIRNERH